MPRASRLRVSVLRQPRVLAGVLLVLVATIVGAVFFARATQSSEYWVLSRDVRAGQPLTSADLAVTEAVVRGATADALVPAGTDLPDGARWASDRASGTLLTRDAWTTEASAVHELPLRVADGKAPHDLAAGDVVDVWVGPGDQDPDAATAVVLEAVRVVDVGSSPSSVERTVLVDVGSPPEADLMAALARATVTVVRRS